MICKVKDEALETGGAPFFNGRNESVRESYGFVRDSQAFVQ